MVSFTLFKCEWLLNIGSFLCKYLDCIEKVRTFAPAFES